MLGNRVEPVTRQGQGWKGQTPGVRLVLLVLLAGLLLFSLYTVVQLRQSRGRLPAEMARWMWVLGEAVEHEVLARPERPVDPGVLAELRERFGLDHLAWVEGPELPGLAAEDGARLHAGQRILSPAYRDERGRWVRSLYLPVRLPTRLRILAITLDFSAYEQPGARGETGLLVQVIGLLAAVLAIGLLLWRLRANERELERLRAVAEERAHTVEGYHAAIVQSVASGVITFTTDRIITTLNPAAERILGVVLDHTVGRTCAEAFGADSRFSHLLEAAVAHETVAHREEIAWAWPSGERSWIGLSSSLVRDQEGRVIGTTFVFTDLTEAKRLQEQLEVGQRLALLGEMSAGIAHEFRNYMGTLLGYARLLAKQLPEGDPKRQTTEAMAAELHAMDRLINDLLSLGRADQQRLNHRPVALGDLLHRVVGQLTDQTVAAGPPPETTGQAVPERAMVDVAFEIAADLPQIQADDGLLRQAFTNVVQNALDAMSSGGRLRVRAFLRPHTTGRPQEVEVAISDTGPGIPAALRSKIFLPFVTTKQRGTGIGLTLVQKIMHSHDGLVEVESRPGQTTFRFLFPLRAVGRPVGHESRP